MFSITVTAVVPNLVVYTKPGLRHGPGLPCGPSYDLPYGPLQILYVTNNEEKNYLCTQETSIL